MSVNISAKFSEKELYAVEKTRKELGLRDKSELVREAVRLYLGLMSTETVSRLKILRALNEVFGSSGKSAGELIEEVREEDEL